MLSLLASYIAGLRSLPACALAFLAGAACVFAFAPFHFLPILLVVLPVLVWLLDGAESSHFKEKARRVIALSWAFGAGFYGVGCYWITQAFLVDSDEHAKLLILPILFLLVALPLFFIATCFIARIWCWGEGLWRVLCLAALLTLSDWIRGHVLTGFPWNLWGNTLTRTSQNPIKVRGTQKFLYIGQEYQ